MSFNETEITFSLKDSNFYCAAFGGVANSGVTIGISRCFVPSEKPLASFTNCAVFIGQCFNVAAASCMAYRFRSESLNEKFSVTVTSCAFYAVKSIGAKAEKQPRFTCHAAPRTRRISSGNLANRNCVTFTL